MDLSPSQFSAAVRKDGWSPECKARFLSLLAEAGNVRLSARRCGLSAQSAYVHRRRDPLFARGWDAALELARPYCEEVLADRAIEGIEEEVWYRGELVGTRRRYDSRLLLAHLARLDARTGSEQAEEDAARFDEIVALVAGVEAPESLLGEDDLPLSRDAHLARAAAEAEDDAWDALPRGCDAEERDETIFDAVEAAEAGADTAFTAWLEQARAVVDELQDSVNLSTSEAPDAADPVLRGEGTAATRIAPDSVNPSTSPEPAPSLAADDLAVARARIVSALTARSNCVNPSTSGQDRGEPEAVSSRSLPAAGS